ncbi:SAM-dependent methyltransferase [Nocardia transvalensis]|uniref:SAM-dependent methyltransferase n=1 Tax=Nocardia transvalensis TaxID=37333 RepID=A0A7W9UIQ2_9NOCA|nr:class I SAM-dependent methyltransferase [Nocardia transvalensis]MBB5914432.1 SAM-dependent methyltransferase [Nocardia transvalensis]
MSYESPLSYALGLEGIALLRTFAGERDRDFGEARIDEIRRLLDDPALRRGIAVEVVDTVAGYEIWADTYDGPNPAFDFDEPVVRDIAGALPPGTALDAACGTGRVAEVLADCGHHVVGVDSSPHMLDHARKRLPEADFRAGDLQELPVDDASVDIVTCSLALSHIPDLVPAYSEFARVLRPGGHVVITDIHPEQVARTHVPTVRRPDGTPARLRTYPHRTGDHLRAALAAGLSVRGCEEPSLPAPEPGEPATGPGPWEAWPWSLAALTPAAAHLASEGVPAVIIWHLHRD